MRFQAHYFNEILFRFATSAPIDQIPLICLLPFSYALQNRLAYIAMLRSTFMLYLYRRFLCPNLPSSAPCCFIRAGPPSLEPQSVYLFGFAALGVAMAARAGETGYADLGIWQTQYILFTPSVMFGITMMAEYWVQSLPSQVRPRGRRMPYPVQRTANFLG